MRIGLDITVLNDQEKTGIAVYTYNLIEALLNKNKKNQFILFAFSALSTHDNLSNLPFKNYPFVEVKIIKIPSRVFSTVFLTWQKLNWPPIENFIGNVDIFHSFNFYLPPQDKGKVIATVFDMTPILFADWHLKKTVQLEKVRLDGIAKHADLVITISENSKKDFLKFYPKKKVEVIYPAVSKKFLSAGADPRILDKYGLKPGYILSVGTLEPRKNIHGLIKAYLKKKFDVPLIIVGGKGWKAEQINDLSKKSDKIKILGFVEDNDLPTIYKGSLMFVYPSFYEGFGIPVLEAMNCGVPVITSNTSSLPEVGGKAAIYVHPKNTDEIAKAMQSAKGSEGIRVRMIKQGLQEAKKFSYEESAKRLISLYQNLKQE